MKHINTKELKETIDVKKLLEYYEFEQLGEDGRGWVTTLCPYHEDSNPSFGMRESDTFFSCWSCKESGDAIKLVMDLENITFQEALDKLAGMFGYSTEGDSCLEYLEHMWGHKKGSKNPVVQDGVVYNARIRSLHKLATDISVKEFAGSEAERYLKSRGFTSEVAREYQLGFMPEVILKNKTFYALAKHFKFTEEEIKVAGYDYPRFKNRLVFPVSDTTKEIVALSGRALHEEDVPKYTASPNSEYYKKGFFLYGLDKIRTGELVTLVEGNLDYVRLSSLGINTLAQLGSALTDNQCNLLVSVAEGVQLMADGDDAGRKSMFKSVLPLISKGLHVGVTRLPYGEDPDTFFRNLGKDEALRTIIRDKLTISGLEYYFEYTRNNGESNVNTLIDCLSAVGKIKDKNIFDIHVKNLAELTGFEKSTLESEIKKVSYG